MNKKPEKKEKTKKGELQLLRGMKDILPNEQDYWELIRNKVAQFASLYGYERLDPPVLESTALFLRSTGKYSDVVEKEMFSFIDKGGDNVSLRPELTPSMCRAYIEHGMVNLPQPVKLYTLAPVFRHDKPQAGRYRQFYQIDFEVIGSSRPVIDAEMIAIQYFLYKDLGLQAQVQINSVGCPHCRPTYENLLREYYHTKKRNLCETCKKRLQRNALRLLDCKEEACREMAEGAPQFLDNLCEECREHFVKVLEHLDAAEIPYTLNSHIVRGLDYYTKTAFEFYPILGEGEKEGSQSAISGGGRYDLLISELGGREGTGAIGFAIGVERLILLLKAQQITIPAPKQIDIFLAQVGESARKQAIRLLEELRKAGFNARALLDKESLSAQLSLASKLGVKFTLILGQKEMLDKTILLRDMSSGAQEIVDVKKVQHELSKRLDKLNGEK